MSFQVSGGGSPVKTIRGYRLAKRLKAISPDFRALLAHELVTGEVVLRDLTQAQAAALVRVSLPYVSTVAGRVRSSARASSAGGSRFRPSTTGAAPPTTRSIGLSPGSAPTVSWPRSIGRPCRPRHGLRGAHE